MAFTNQDCNPNKLNETIRNLIEDMHQSDIMIDNAFAVLDYILSGFQSTIDDGVY